MRTNIVIEEKLIEEARRLTSLPTKKAVVDEALRTLIRKKTRKDSWAARENSEAAAVMPVIVDTHINNL